MSPEQIESLRDEACAEHADRRVNRVPAAARINIKQNDD